MIKKIRGNNQTSDKATVKRAISHSDVVLAAPANSVNSQSNSNSGTYTNNNHASSAFASLCFKPRRSPKEAVEVEEEATLAFGGSLNLDTNAGSQQRQMPLRQNNLIKSQSSQSERSLLNRAQKATSEDSTLFRVSVPFRNNPALVP